MPGYTQSRGWRDVSALQNPWSVARVTSPTSSKSLACTSTSQRVRVVSPFEKVPYAPHMHIHALCRVVAASAAAFITFWRILIAFHHFYSEGGSSFFTVPAPTDNNKLCFDFYKRPPHPVEIRSHKLRNVLARQRQQQRRRLLKIT